MTGVDPIVSRSAAGTSSSRTHLSLTGVESLVADQSQAIDAGHESREAGDVMPLTLHRR
jgi:hypothetical protein